MKKAEKKMLAIIMAFTMVTGLFPALTISVSAAEIGPLSATVDIPLQMTLYELSGGADLDPETNGGTYYTQSYTQPHSGPYTGELYINNPNDIEWDYEYTEATNGICIYEWKA